MLRLFGILLQNWRYYDEQFRYLRQSSPVDFPWGQVHWELWFLSLHNFRGQSGSQSFQPKSARKGQLFFPKGTCWAFHAGKTCNGCQYEHVCYKCHKGHPASQCHSNGTNNSQPRLSISAMSPKSQGIHHKSASDSAKANETSGVSPRV